MKLADPAFGQGHDLHTREAQMLERGSDIRLIAEIRSGTSPAHIELAALSILQERLYAGPQDHARA